MDAKFKVMHFIVVLVLILIHVISDCLILFVGMEGLSL